MNQNVLSVTQLVNQVKNLLEGSFRNVTIEGEITNLSGSSSGHWYFTLSDKGAAISAALFKMDAFRNPIVKKLKDGDKVVVSGSLGVYSKRGTFQIIAKRITPVGKGDLKEQFDILKKRLSQEGLFDLDIKKKIPEMPKKIAVITAQGSAAMADFINIMKRRSHHLELVVVPALVQGDAAPASIRNALFKTIKYSLESDVEIDAIVLTRGGGSLEDLWAFNDEALAWDIFNCPIPIISAVGHQVDFSISDFVADLRCETPSAAAEILSHGQTEIVKTLSNYSRRLENLSTNILSEYKHRTQSATPRVIVDKIWSRYISLQRRLDKCKIHNRIYELTNVHEYQMRLDEVNNSLIRTADKMIDPKKNEVERMKGLLDALNPNNILGRGYSYLKNEKGEVIASSKQYQKLKDDSSFSIQFNDGLEKAKKVSL